MRWTSGAWPDCRRGANASRRARRIIQEAGGRLIGVYVTLGRYDVVEIFEAPDDEMAAESSCLQRHGAEHTETLRASRARGRGRSSGGSDPDASRPPSPHDSFPGSAFAPCPPLKSVEAKTSRVCDVRADSVTSSPHERTPIPSGWTAPPGSSGRRSPPSPPCSTGGRVLRHEAQPRAQPAAASPHRLQSSGKWDEYVAPDSCPGEDDLGADRGAGAHGLSSTTRAASRASAR